MTALRSSTRDREAVALLPSPLLLKPHLVAEHSDTLIVVVDSHITQPLKSRWVDVLSELLQLDDAVRVVSLMNDNPLYTVVVDKDMKERGDGKTSLIRW
jgi:hypothetical protein